MEIVAFFSLFLVGLSYGASACLLSCMPFLSPIILVNSSKAEAMRVMIPFSFGRITTYMMISLAAFLSAAMVQHLLDDEIALERIFGVFVVGISFLMLYRAFETKRCCSTNVAKPTKGLGFFGLGVLISFNPCLPVLSLVSVSSMADSPLYAILFGICFGVGATLVQFLLFGFFLSHVASGIKRELAAHRQKIEIFAAAILMLTGFFVFGGYIER